MRERIKRRFYRLGLWLAGRCEPPYQCYWARRALAAEAGLDTFELDRKETKIQHLAGELECARNNMRHWRDRHDGMERELQQVVSRYKAALRRLEEAGKRVLP